MDLVNKVTSYELARLESDLIYSDLDLLGYALEKRKVGDEWLNKSLSITFQNKETRYTTQVTLEGTVKILEGRSVPHLELRYHFYNDQNQRLGGKMVTEAPVDCIILPHILGLVNRTLKTTDRSNLLSFYSRLLVGLNDDGFGEYTRI